MSRAAHLDVGSQVLCADNNSGECHESGNGTGTHGFRSRLHTTHMVHLEIYRTLRLLKQRLRRNDTFILGLKDQLNQFLFILRSLMHLDALDAGQLHVRNGETTQHKRANQPLKW